MPGTYISPAETGFYYLQSRYYDAGIGRFVNADGYASTGQGIPGSNMFAYCGNNPVNRTDSSGMKWWDSVKNFCTKTWKKVKTWANSTFGKESTTSVTRSKKIIPEPSPLVITSGNTTTTMTMQKNNTNPIIGYADSNTNGWSLSSTMGVKINISKVTIDFSFGLEDIGITGSYTNEETTRSLGLRLNISELRCGVEGAKTVQWDADVSDTTFTNVSISAIGIAMAYALATGNMSTYAVQK